MVTSVQAIAARPIQYQIEKTEAAISAATAANGTAGVNGGTLNLVDADGNALGSATFTVLLTPSQAVALFSALETVFGNQLTDLQATLAAI